MCSECVQSVIRVSSECRQSVIRVSSECLQSVFRVSLECLQSVFRVCSECVQSVFNIEVISSSSASSVSIFGIFFYVTWILDFAGRSPLLHNMNSVHPPNQINFTDIASHGFISYLFTSSKLGFCESLLVCLSQETFPRALSFPQW